ncbi:MAG: IS4 family transposase, partial [Phycisphaerae bacterium]|nr:IS4 family transposase [Phycisphaerae bacterium]
TLLQILSLSLFEKMPILQAFSQQEYKTAIGDNDNQLNLFNL